MRKSVYVYLAILLAAIMLIDATASAQWEIRPQSGRLIRPKRMPKETPELQLEHARTLMVDGDYKKAMDETVKFRNFYGDSEFADENQFLRGEIAMAQGKPKKALKEFQLVVTTYPESDLFDDVIAKQYEIGDAFYEQGLAKQDQGWWRLGWGKKRPFRRAIDTYTMVIDNQPFTAAAA